ncbi:MAG: hypothetical protein R3D26_02265 [Cyanobacteriota/Melainabacteria group bacterium]
MPFITDELWSYLPKSDFMAPVPLFLLRTISEGGFTGTVDDVAAIR